MDNEFITASLVFMMGIIILIMFIVMVIVGISCYHHIKEDKQKFGNTKNVKKLFIIILLFCSILSYGQTNKLIAKAEVRNIEMTYHINGFDLYDNFENNITHYKSTYIPNKFNIDMKNFTMPVKTRIVTSSYGKRWGRMHKGTDIKGYIGDTIYAAFSGKVRVVKYDAHGYGNFVIIRHYNGLETYYGHMSKQLVNPNQEVKSGDPIGLVGNTGRSTGAHLHFETRLCGKSINPELLFDFRLQDIKNDYYEFRSN